MSDKNNELEIQQKVYDMMLYAYPILDNFPKSQKFSMVQDIKKTMDSVLKLVIEANKKKSKLATLQKLDVELAALRVYVRLAYDLGYFRGANNYMTFSGKITEVGNMLGGWIKSEVTKADLISSNDYFCSNCGSKINKKVYDYSIKAHGKALCYTCQKTSGNKL